MAKQAKKKTATLSKSDKLYIQNNSSLNIPDLAEDTGKTQKLVKEYIAELQAKSGRKVDDLMAKRTKGVVVMTESASSLADEKKKVEEKIAPPQRNKFIHKIRD